jgi:hypothetical protein
MPHDPKNTKAPKVLPPARQDNYGSSRFNALRHGLTSQYLILPGEDESAYNTLLEAVVADAKPQGPIEEHYVEELASAIWHKARLRRVERAAFIRNCAKTIKGVFVHVDAEHENEAKTVMETVREMTEEACRLLDDKSASSYSQALAALHEDTREWWDEQLSEKAEDYQQGETPYHADSDSLNRFLETVALPWCDQRRGELEHRSQVREQAFGEAISPYQLKQLARQEVHLDRMRDKALVMLLELQNRRRAADPMIMSPAKTSKKPRRRK